MMDSKEETVDKTKLEAALRKLEANPDILRPLEKALNDMFAKLNLGLNQREALALVQKIFPGHEPLGAKDAVSIPYGGGCTVKLIAYACTSCTYG